MGLDLLVVDDSMITRNIIRRAVGMCGVDVQQFHEASNGRQALDILHAQAIDLVFADLNMPVMTGAELVEAMRNDSKLQGIPVVIISSDRGPIIEALMSKGTIAYLAKPFRPESLRDTLDKVLSAATARPGGTP